MYFSKAFKQFLFFFNYIIKKCNSLFKVFIVTLIKYNAEGDDIRDSKCSRSEIRRDDDESRRKTS